MMKNSDTAKRGKRPAKFVAESVGPTSGTILSYDVLSDARRAINANMADAMPVLRKRRI